MTNAIADRLRWSYWVQDDSQDLDRLLTDLADADPGADAVGSWPDGLWTSIVNAKVPGWSLPADLGGEDCGRSLLLTRYAQVAEASLTAAFILSQHDAGIRRLLANRGRAVAQSWLAQIAGAEAFVTVGISQLTTSRRHGAQALVATGDLKSGYLLDGVMPWVTAAERADVVVAGAVTPDGQQLLIALPMDRPGVSVQPPFPLAALQASMTAEIRCDRVVVSEADILIGPADNVMNHSGATGTGGLETSALALGQARAAIFALASDSESRPELVESVQALAETWHNAWSDLIAAAEEASNAPASSKIRAAANNLVLHATTAFLTSKKGSGFVREEPAQRWARQALFFLVWSCPTPIAQEMIRDMAGICDS